MPHFFSPLLKGFQTGASRIFFAIRFFVNFFGGRDEQYGCPGGHRRRGILVELSVEKAPLTVANFLTMLMILYVGTLFHRVIKGFMIQGGGLDNMMREKTMRGPHHERGRQSAQKC